MHKISTALLNPKTIVVVGGSNDTSKPGGKVLFNLINNEFEGDLLVVNPKETKVQGVHSYHNCNDLPQVDLAIIAIAAKFSEETIKVLSQEKNCKAFILFSAGFGEIGAEGKKLEASCAAIVAANRGTLIGPNCIGVITQKYKGVFAGPIPAYDPQGCDCVSESGATMVYILEMAIARGLKFRDIFSIGNGAQIGVEDVLEFWDETFDPQHSSKIKLLYLEKVSDPARFMKHSRSLYQKGCRLAAIKSGATDEGSRAVSSHTGALSGSNIAVSALFRKSGVIRCSSRIELVYIAAIFTFNALKGNRIAVITHAGGPGVMLTDELIKGGMQVPHLDGPKAEQLLSKLFPGATVANPIDFLATGTAEQLGAILDAVTNDFHQVDAAVVVFGTTGMWKVDDVYKVLHEKMATSAKPIFPILPSMIQAAEEVSLFQSMGHVNFTDEVSFAYTLSRVYRREPPFEFPVLPKVDLRTIREIIEHSEEGFLPPNSVVNLLKAVGIKTVPQATINNKIEIPNLLNEMGFPLVLKVIGPVHKTEAGGVILNINSSEQALEAYHKLMNIEGATSVLVQKQLVGIEVFIGASKETPFGHVILCGLGGIFVEVFQDVSSAIAPVGQAEALSMIHHLKSYPIIKGYRGKEGVNELHFADTLVRLSALLQAAPEIRELDINPLLGNAQELIAVDARISIDKSRLLD